MSKEGEDAYEQLGPNAAPEAALPPPPPAPPPEPPANDVKPKGEEKTQTHSVEHFALRPGDDVDLSSERGTIAKAASEENASKSKEKIEVDKKLEEPLKPSRSDIKPYKESAMLKFCHIVTLLLLVFSFLLLAVIVIQFVDIFVWVPLLLGE